jgi:hypothetical protein
MVTKLLTTNSYTADPHADCRATRSDDAQDAAPAKPFRKRARIKIGGVVVAGDKASALELKRSVALSSDMLGRLASKVAKRGVRLHAGKDVPLYSVDPDRPDRLVRKLNGKVDRGVLENGVFKVVE